MLFFILLHSVNSIATAHSKHNWILSDFSVFFFCKIVIRNVKKRYFRYWKQKARLTSITKLACYMLRKFVEASFWLDECYQDWGFVYIDIIKYKNCAFSIKYSAQKLLENFNFYLAEQYFFVNFSILTLSLKQSIKVFS